MGLSHPAGNPSHQLVSNRALDNKRKLRARAALSAAALVATSSLAMAADRTWDGGGANNSVASGGNWVGDVAPIAGDALIFDGINRMTPVNNFAIGTSFAGLTFTATAGAFNLSGNQMTLGGNILNNTALLTQNINLDLLLSGTRTVTVIDGGLLTIGGTVSGSGFGLTKNGLGLLTLTAANTFTGPVTINGGVLSISGDTNFGIAPGSPTAGQLVIDGGTLRTTSNLTFSANRGIALGNGGGGVGTIETNTNTTLTYRGIIGNGGGVGGLSKLGFGTMIVSRANTYSGRTQLRNGVLQLEFNQPDSPTDNIINSASSLSLGGSTAGLGSANFSQLLLVGSGTTTNTQSFASTHVDIGPAILRWGGTAGTVNLSLGALTHTPGGVLNIARPASGTSTGTVSTTTTNLGSTGIIGGWATVGVGTLFNNVTAATTFASVDGGGNIVDYTGYLNQISGTNTVDTPGFTASSNIDVGAMATARIAPDGAGTTIDVNTIRNNEGTGKSIRIGTGNTLRLGQYGAIFKSDQGSQPTWAIGSSDGGANGIQDDSFLTAGGAPNTPGEIVFNLNQSSQTTGSLNVEVKIVDNGTGPVTVVKTGPGSMKLRGKNTYTGGTYLLSGRVQLAGSELGNATLNGNNTGFGTGPVFVFPGAQAFPSGVGDVAAGGLPIPNNFFIAGRGLQGEADTGVIRFGGGVQISGTVTLIGDARIAGGGATAGITGKITGPYNLDIGALQTINSTLSLFNPANDWTGNTTINARNTATANTLTLRATEVIPNGLGKGNVIMNGNTSTGSILLNMNGFSETVNGLSTTADNPAGAIIRNNAAGSLSTLTVGDNDQSATFAGLIENGTGTIALVKIGAGIQTLAGTNTYTGGTSINAGALSVTGSLASSGTVNLNTSATSAGRLSGTGQVGNVVMAANNSGNRAAIEPGATGSSSVGTLSLSSLQVGGGALRFDLFTAGSNQDFISVSGNANFTAATTIEPGPTGEVGTYTVLQASSLSLGVSPTLVQPTDTRNTYTLDLTTPNQIKIGVTGGAKDIRWTGSASNDWDIAGANNWLDLNPPNGVEKFFNGDKVVFNDSAAVGNRNVQIPVATTVTPGSMTISHASGSADYVFSGQGALSSSGSLTKDGTGGAIIAVSNTSTGTVIINAGSLQVGNGGTLGGLGSGTVLNSAALIFNRSNDFTQNNVISGTGSLTKIGAGTLTLGGTSNFSGNTAVNAGVLRVSNFSALGDSTGSINVAAGAALDIGGVNVADTPSGFQSKQVNIAGTGVGTGALINTGASQAEALQRLTLTANATIGGTGQIGIRNGGATLNLAGFTLTKDGTNTLNVDGGFISDGNIIVNGGVLSIQANTSVVAGSGNITVNAAGSLQALGADGTFTITRPVVLNGGTITNGASAVVGSSFIGSNIQLTANSTIAANSNGGNNALTLVGAISQDATPRSITKVGGGSLELVGNNTFTGGLNINAGTVMLSNAGALNSTTPNAVNFGTSATATTALRLNGNSVTISGLTTNATTPGTPIVENQGPANATLTVNTSTNNVFAGTVTDNGSQLSLTKAGTGTLVLSGTSNYNGATTISGGTLQIGNAGTTGAIGNADVTNNANLAFNRTNAATFSNAISGTGSVHHNGTGSTVLTNNSTYSGSTEINAGALIVTGSLLNTGAVNVNTSASSAGILSGTGSVGNVTLAANNGLNIASIRPGQSAADGDNGTLTMNSLTVNGGNFRLDSGGSDRITVTGAANFAGASTVTPVFPNVPTAGVVTLLTSSNLTGTAPTLTNVVTSNGEITNSRLNFTLNFDVANNNEIQLAITGAPKSITWTGSGTTTWDINNNVNWTDGAPEKFFNLDTVTLNDTAAGANRAVTLNVAVKPTAVTVDHSTGADYSITGTGTIEGTTGLTKTGTGTLVLGLANTYTGGTNIQDGTIRLATSTALPAGGSLSLGNNAALDLGGVNATVGSLTGNNTSVIGNSNTVTNSVLTHSNGTTTYSGVIQNTLGAGNKTTGLSVTGGELSLTGANTYSGPTNVAAAGTLRVNDGGSLGASSVTIAGTVNFDRNDTATVANVFAGAGTFLKSGGGTVILTGANTNTGPVILNGGTLQVGNGGTSGSMGTGAVTANSTLAFRRSDAHTVNNTIGGGGEVIIDNGTGTTILGGTNTYTNTTRVLSGAVRPVVSASLGAIPGGNVIVSSGGAVDLAANVTANNINFGQKQFIIVGTGVGGTGALTNSGTLAQQNAFQRVQLSGNASIGGAARFDIRAAQVAAANVASLDLQGNTLTKIGNNQVTLVATDVSDGNIVVNQGTLAFETTTLLQGAANGANGSVNFAGDDTRLQFFNTSGTTTVTRPIHIFGAGTTGVQVGNNSATASIFSSPIILHNPVTFTQFGSTGPLTHLGVISEVGGSYGIIKTAGAGATTLTLGGNNTFTGGVRIDGGGITLANPGAINSTTPNTVTFGPSAANTAVLHLNGNSVTIAGLATNVVPGTPVVENNFAAPVTLTINNAASFAYAGTIRNGAAAGGTVTLVKNGAGAQSLLGTNSWTGGTTVNAGTLIASNLRTGPLTINTGGTTRIAANGTANLAAGTSITPALTIAAGGVLDLTNNSMITDYTGPVGTLVDDTRQHLQSGRMVTTSGTGLVGLGYANNAALSPVKTTFAGQTVDASSLLVKFTYFGDTDLDGKVDVADLGILATNWQTSQAWSGGDFDYNGSVNVNDLGLLATNWQAGVGSPLGPDFATAAAALGLPSVAVPEPASISLLAALAGLSLKRRTRRSN